MCIRDSDGLGNGIDRFALDPTNGFARTLAGGDTLALNLRPPAPLASPFDAGFTGVMTNGTGSYLDRISTSRVTVGPQGLTIHGVTEGSAFAARNTQLDALQFGLDLDSTVRSVTFEQVIDNPFDTIANRQNYQNIGMFIGTGDQDNYVKLVAGMNAGPSFEVLSENAAVTSSQRYAAAIFGNNVPLTSMDTITMRLEVDVATGVATPSWQWTVGRTASAEGQTFSGVGNNVVLTGATLAALNGSYTVTPAGGGDPVPSALAVGILSTSAGVAQPFDATVLSFTAATTKVDGGAQGRALLTITPQDGLNTSTFDANTLVLANQSSGAQQITQVIIDLGESVLTDRVFWDPSGAGGSAGKGFTVNGRTGTFNVTAAYEEGTSATGFDQLVLNLTGFDPGEAVRFSIDIDPDSFIGFPQSVTAGAVTGVETSGARMSVHYSDGTTHEADVFGAGGPGAGRALAQPDIDAAPVLSLNGATTGKFAVTQATQTLSVQGEAGGQVRVMLLTGEMQNVPAADAFDANTATAVQYQTVQLDATGLGQLAVTVPEDHPLMIVGASVDAQGTATSFVSDRIVLAYNPPTAGIVDGTLMFAAPSGEPETARLMGLLERPATDVPEAPYVYPGDDGWTIGFDPHTGSLVHHDDAGSQVFRSLDFGA